MSTQTDADTRAPIAPLPPQNPEAEEAVLCALMVDREAALALRGVLAVEDFYRERHRVIFEAACRVLDDSAECDMVTLADELKRTGRFEEVGGLVYLHHLTDYMLMTAHAEDYAEIVRRTAYKRRLISAAGKIAGAAYDDGLSVADTEARVWEILRGVQAPETERHDWGAEEMSNRFIEMVADLTEGRGLGIPSGFCDLDHLTGGWRPKKLVVLIADTSTGKSAWALSTAVAMGDAGQMGGYITLEMGVDEMLAREAAASLGMKWSEVEYRLSRGRNVEGLTAPLAKARDDIGRVKLRMYDAPRQSVATIKAKAREWQARYGIKWLIVDYLQLLDMPERDNRAREIAVATRELKALAMEMEIPVILLCQINRDLKGREDKRPTRHDARESGAIEQDADVLLGLYRADLYHKVEEPVGPNGEKKYPVVPGRAELWVLKNRAGPTGWVNLTWQPNLVRFTNYAAEIPF